MPLGIPHSIFLGRVHQPGDPYWLPEDIDKALEWRRYEAELCGDCRTRRSDWWDELGRNLQHPKYRIVVKRCPGCEKWTSADHELRDKAGEDSRQLWGKKVVFEAIPNGVTTR